MVRPLLGPGKARGCRVCAAWGGEEPGSWEERRAGGLGAGPGRGLQALGTKPGPGAWPRGGEGSLLSLKAQEQEKPGAWGWQSGWRVGPAGDWRCCGSLLSARGPGWRWRGRPGTQTLLHEPWGPGQQMGGRPGYGGGPGVRPAGLSPQQPPGTPKGPRVGLDKGSNSRGPFLHKSSSAHQQSPDGKTRLRGAPQGWE